MPHSPERRHACLAAACALFPTFVWAAQPAARTWYVKADGSGDVPTIQAGVDSAAPGDVVLVAAGNYTWANQGGDPMFGMIFVARGQDRFTLRSESGPLVTTLDAQRQNRVIFIQGLNGVTVEGFTITGGRAPAANPSGGGLACHLSSDVVRNCRFLGNSAQAGGGLWNGGVSTLRVENCEFRYNAADLGGAMYFINSSTTQRISDCVIDQNNASMYGGAVYAVNNALVVTGTVFSRNVCLGSGGAFGARSLHSASLTGCTISENQGVDGGAIYLLDCPDVSLGRSIVAYQGEGVAYALYAGSVLTVSCTDSYANPGGEGLPVGAVDAGGNFSLDPQFCGFVGSQVYEINAASPCAEGNHPDDVACGLVGARGVACGQVPVEATSWGKMKASYRR